ncbi:hypothetical protein [Streptococcus catagoni]|uniref:hypothetical protein n=1 Tax=Streptococcus catagoni TaxID=2654874 RepID=UPI001409325E|nr:hypothetical protein [Streptococcus catagoni]
MATKSKARKHALRKAVTTAVLASTAMGTLGRALTSATTVKASGLRRLPQITDFDRERLFTLISDRKYQKMEDKDILAELRDVLDHSDVSTLLRLTNGLNPSDINYRDSILRHIEKSIGAFTDPVYRNKVHSLTSLLYRNNSKKIS